MIIAVICMIFFVLICVIMMDYTKETVETKEEYVKKPIQEEVEDVKEIKSFYFPKIKEVNIDKVYNFV